MSAPTPTVRGVPAGRRIPEGFKSLITFASDPTVGFWEIQLKPPGVDGGQEIDITTQHNSTWHTMYPRTLKKLDPVTFEGAYDIDFLPSIISLVNKLDTITVLFPDGSTFCFFGWLQKIEFGELKEGEFPKCNGNIVPANVDPSSNVLAEQGPVFTAAAGT